MNTLLLRLAGPMQSWGVQSNFGMRDTGREPSKSGVAGLLCAALGRPRTEPVEDLVALRMGVRADQEGKLEMDYHTAQRVYRAAGGQPKPTELSNRYYLADAVFLVGLVGEDLAFLGELHAALRDPRWPLYLGRKAFVPSPPVWLPDGLRKGESLLDALALAAHPYPFLGRGDPPQKLRLVFDDPDGEQVRPDLPISFAERRFAPRRVTTRFLEISFPSKEVT